MAVVAIGVLLAALGAAVATAPKAAPAKVKGR
jgi:hypothetical protein